MPILSLLGRYAPEYNCLLRGIATYKPILAKTFEGGMVKQYIEFPATQVRGYDQRDIPEYADKRGPSCYGLPNNPEEPWPGKDCANGTDLDCAPGRGNSYFPDGAEPGPTFLADLIGALSGQPIARPAASTRATPAAAGRDAAMLSVRTGRSADHDPGPVDVMLSPRWRNGRASADGPEAATP